MKKKTVDSDSLISRIFYKAQEGDISMLDSADKLPDGEIKDHYLALRKEFNKMIEERKKFLNKRYPLEPLSNINASEVEKLFVERFRENGYGNDTIHRARKLWQDFVNTKTPRIREPLPWVASLDFIVRGFTIQNSGSAGRITQKLIAQEYGLTFSKLNQCYRSIANSIGIDRYFSNTDNIESIYNLLKSVFRVAKRFRKHSGSVEIKNMKAQEAWLDNIYKYALILRSNINLK